MTSTRYDKGKYAFRGAEVSLAALVAIYGLFCAPGMRCSAAASVSQWSLRSPPSRRWSPMAAPSGRRLHRSAGAAGGGGSRTVRAASERGEARGQYAQRPLSRAAAMTISIVECRVSRDSGSIRPSSWPRNGTSVLTMCAPATALRAPSSRRLIRAPSRRSRSIPVAHRAHFLPAIQADADISWPQEIELTACTMPAGSAYVTMCPAFGTR